MHHPSSGVMPGHASIHANGGAISSHRRSMMLVNAGQSRPMSRRCSLLPGRTGQRTGDPEIRLELGDLLAQ
jgi:hypothetical protein